MNDLIIFKIYVLKRSNIFKHEIPTHINYVHHELNIFRFFNQFTIFFMFYTAIITTLVGVFLTDIIIPAVNTIIICYSKED